DTGTGKKNPVLPGFYFRTVRPGAGNSAKGNYPLLSPVSLCRSQALRLLDYGQLPRGLWYLCLQWNPVQPRKPGAWRNLRYTENYTRPHTHQTEPAKLPVPGKSGLITGL